MIKSQIKSVVAVHWTTRRTQGPRCGLLGQSCVRLTNTLSNNNKQDQFLTKAANAFYPRNAFSKAKLFLGHHYQHDACNITLKLHYTCFNVSIGTNKTPRYNNVFLFVLLVNVPNSQLFCEGMACRGSWLMPFSCMCFIWSMRIHMMPHARYCTTSHVHRAAPQHGALRAAGRRLQRSFVSLQITSSSKRHSRATTPYLDCGGGLGELEEVGMCAQEEAYFPIMQCVREVGGFWMCEAARLDKGFQWYDTVGQNGNKSLW